MGDSSVGSGMWEKVMTTKEAHRKSVASLVSGCAGFISILMGPQPPVEYSFNLPTVPMGNLRPAQSCQVYLPTFGHLFGGDWAAPHGSFTMTNDGGWCWVQFGQTFRSLRIVPDVRVVELPAHGEVTALRMADRVSVAYRPVTGFAGTDHFEVRTDGPIPHNIPFDVVVR
jgi:hypothetical protein